MIKSLVFSFALLFTSHALASYVPTSAKGQQQASGTAATTIQVPENQATKVSASATLLETGNKNLLVNPSFEHSTFSTGWTSSGCSALAGSGAGLVAHGMNSYRIFCTAATPSLQQESTTNASALAGSQMLAMVRVKTALTDVKVCAVQDSVVSTTLCVDVQSNDSFAIPYKVPFVAGSTSSGIWIGSASSKSGSIYVDDAFVGPVDLKHDNAACADVFCETEFSATISTTSTVSNENLTDFINGNCTYSSGDHTCTFGTNIFSVAPNCTVSINASSGSIAGITSTSATQVVVRTRTTVDAQLSFKLACQKQGADYVSAKARTGAYYSATCGAACLDKFSAKFSSGGVASAEDVEWVTGNASVASSVYTITVAGFTVAPKCTATTAAGGTNRGVDVNVTSATTVVVRTFAADSGGAIDAAFTLKCEKTGVDFIATRTIVGQFNEVTIAPGVSKPVHRSARLNCDAASSILGQDGTTWVSAIGNINASGECSVTMVAGSFSTTPHCQISRYATSGFTTGIEIGGGATSATNYFMDAEDDAGAAATAYDVNLDCWGAL